MQNEFFLLWSKNIVNQELQLLMRYSKNLAYRVTCMFWSFHSKMSCIDKDIFSYEGGTVGK